MTDLKCDVKTCAYNEKKLCSKGDIMVGGRQALRSQETSCDSFRDKKRDRFVSSLDHPSATISIDCEAENCKYNSNYRCSAGHVNISGCNACGCGDTLCATFTER